MASPTQPRPDGSPCSNLSVLLRRTKDGPGLLRKDLSAADLLDLRSEAWHTMFLRKGRTDVAVDDLTFDTIPHFRSGDSGPLEGFSLATTGSAGNPCRYRFSFQAVEHIALGASRELVAAGVLQATDEFNYELTVDLPLTPRPSPAFEIQVMTIASKLKYLLHPIKPLLESVARIGPQEAHSAPVFYTQAAFDRAESYSRRGGNQQPPIETGCILIGALCSCPETGEFYVVVRDALEARDAASKKFSLEYSGQTWTRMQTILRARQSQADGAADRFVGQAHGHPFLPAGGAPPCELCAQRPDLPCGRTSCFVSLDDNDWSRAVFTRQPWQLCHIFGLNARQEHVHKLFGLRDGQLLERGFFVIPEFEPPASAVATPANEPLVVVRH